MHATTVEIDQIVQIVIERLRATTPTLSVPSMKSEPHRTQPQPPISALEVEPSGLVLTDSVISLSTLRDRLEGVHSVRVPSRAIITPAGLDLLRKLNIRLVRTGTDASPQAVDSVQSILNSILVCGSAAWVSNLPNQLDARMATCLPCDDAEASTLVERHVRAGGSGAVWISPTPYSAISKWNVGRDIPAIHLPNLSEFDHAIAQSQAKLIVIAATSWTPAAVGNLVRAWSRSV